MDPLPSLLVAEQRTLVEQQQQQPWMDDGGGGIRTARMRSMGAKARSEAKHLEPEPNRPSQIFFFLSFLFFPLVFCIVY